MKKALIIAVLLGSLLTPSITSAQVVESPQVDIQTQIETLRQQLIEILTQQIIMLQKQIAQILEQQQLVLQQQETMGAVEAVTKRVEEVASGGSAETRLYAGELSCTVNGYKLPITIEGEWVGGRVTTKNDSNRMLHYIELNKTMLKQNGGISIPFRSVVGESVVNIEVQLFSEPPAVHSMGRAFDLTYLIAEKANSVRLPNCE